ncbi:outer membrane beta-barrel protein [Hufsiella ginkgonis]|uniref:Outer membrane beta-barrel protein n=1 Tax=Hufsiella ginkgonis TaxID=2695274 RepID=A0A7K1XV98_9SPHI|nr:outer membrane beta-barrel protein [Hufsiella ginkgonis]MXV14935.1 outer membrane beta-barrel protein [Hufsiella ginkgonis]
MKKICILLSLHILLACTVFAQTPARRPAQPAAPLPVREVSGIVKDTTDQAVIGATVTLTSPRDTVKVSTNAEGIFVLKKIQSPEFTLTVKSLGYEPYVKKFFYTYTSARLVLDPVILKTNSILITDIPINGTPTITYKTDTVEYRAADYKVRENATMEDLLKKMEGIEVDKDGNVTSQGIAVTRARINGQNYGGNDLAGVIRDLPAEIAEKVQVIDDYGDEAALSGVKSGDPQKVLNIVTRKDKSVMNRANFNGSKGTTGRISGNTTLERLNGNQQMNVRMNGNRSVLGVAGGGNGGGGNGGGGNGGGGNFGGSGGTGNSKTGGATFTYNDRINRKLNVEATYGFNLNARNQDQNTVSTEKYVGIDETVTSTRDVGTDNTGYNHNLNLRFQFTPDSSSRMIITPTFSTNGSSNNNNTNRVQRGGINQDTKTKTNSSSSSPNYGLTVNYARYFGKRKASTISFQGSGARSNNESDNTSYSNLQYFATSDPASLYKDSLVNRIRLTDNGNTNYRGSVTFAQRLGATIQLELNARLSYRGYDNDQTTSNLNTRGQQSVVDSLSKLFNYSFTEKRVTLNFRRGNNNTKFNYSLGISGVPGLLKGESQSLGNTTRRESFNMVPVVRLQYRWTRQKQFTLNYNGDPQEPNYTQIQDVPDVSTAGLTVYGNPNLKASFRHNVTANFNNYIAASRITFNASGSYTTTRNQVVTNSIQNKDLYRTRETRFFNLDGGNRTISGNYSLNKSTSSQVLRFRLNGQVGTERGISMNNGTENIRTTWTFVERFNVQIEPREWLQINPNINHTFRKINLSLPISNDSRTKNWDLGVDGRVIAKQRLVFGYDLGKNFVSGLNPTVTKDPFIINTYVRMEFLKRKNASVQVSGSDLLNQNNGANKQVTDLGSTVTASNLNSRYFLVSMTWRPAKYSGSRRTAGPRRGDGSFIQ